MPTVAKIILESMWIYGESGLPPAKPQKPRKFGRGGRRRRKLRRARGLR
jgi:hypothetical protein